jgi:RND superfamily putative drug exporter
MSARLARALVAGRYLVVLAWVAITVAATLLLPSVEEAQSGALGDLVPANADALEAEIRSAELFGFPLQSRTVLVQRDPDGLDPRAQARVLARAAALVRGDLPRFENVPGALPVLNTVGVEPFTRERRTTALTFLFVDPDIGPVGRTGLARLLAERTAGAPGDATVGVTGAVAARTAQSDEITSALPLVELGTVILVALTVGLHFRTVVAPLVTLATVAIAYLVSIRLAAGIGRAIGVSVPKEVEPVVVVLLFGIVTDYAVFFISRMRRLLGDEVRAREAATRSTAELLPTIITAGLTVAFASAALVIAEVGFLRAFGPGMALAVLIGLAVTITFLPALLAISGARLFWPSRPGRSSGRPRRRARRRPFAVPGRSACASPCGGRCS